MKRERIIHQRREGLLQQRGWSVFWELKQARRRPGWTYFLRGLERCGTSAAAEAAAATSAVVAATAAVAAAEPA